MRISDWSSDVCSSDLALIGVDEIRRLWPLINPEGLVGALWHPTDGHIAPVDVTMALAKGARMHGGTIHQQTPVTGIERDGGEWLVRTAKGTISCEQDRKSTRLNSRH